MTIRYVIRPPSISRTPRALAQALGAQTRVSNARQETFDWRTDLFLAFPNIGRVANRPTGNGGSDVYSALYDFAHASKVAQRTYIASHRIPVPETYVEHDNLGAPDPGRFIVRPFRHSGGRCYRVTDDPADFCEGEEYIQRVYPKDREYRIIFVYGEPVVTLVKKRPPDVSQEAAWNHTNGAVFNTVTNPTNDRLKTTDAYERLAAVPIVRFGHVIAADVMWSDTLGYSVCELNTCPGITIPANLERIVSHVQSHQLR